MDLMAALSELLQTSLFCEANFFLGSGHVGLGLTRIHGNRAGASQAPPRLNSSPKNARLECTGGE
jgi:hypothetical protein